MKTVLIFACVLHVIMTAAVTELGHPQYTFRCLENGKIEILGLHAKSKVFVNGSHQGCSSPFSNIIDGTVTLPVACTDIEPGVHVANIHVVDPTFDKSTKPTTNFVGGNNGHDFKIKCKDLPAVGVRKTVAKVFQAGPHEVPVYEREVSSIEMHFRAIKDISAPDIGDISVGDEFFMFLHYKGEKAYKIKPTKCTAYKGDVIPSTDLNIDLWNVNATDLNCTDHKELLAGMEYKSNGNKKDIVATMYGFHFTDSEYITISCQVTVYPENENDEICKHSRRKRETLRMRRETLDTPFKSKTVSGKLKVTDHSARFSSSAGNIPGSFGSFKISTGIMIVLLSFREFW